VKKYILPFLLISFGTVLLIIPSTATYDTFQNHPNKNISLADENGVVWSYDYDTRYGYVVMQTRDINNRYMRLRGCMWAEMMLEAPESCSNHWSMLVASSLTYFRVYFYDKNKNLINHTTANIGTYHHPYPDFRVWEFVKSGESIFLYINGEYKCDVGGTYNRTPCYIKLYPYTTSASYPSELYVDDIMTGDGVIETIPHDWYVLRNWDAPETSGVFNETGSRVNESYFTISYVVPYIGCDACDEIRIKHFTTGEVVNITPISDRYKTIYYNFTEMLFHEDKEKDKYGLYLVELLRDGNVVAHDCFFYTWDAVNKPAGTISWDRDSYPIGCTAKVHTVLTDPDFTTYVYKGYVYDVYGNKKEEWTITSADEWHEVDLTDYDTGVYYAILKIRNKNTGFEWEEAWDTTSVSDEVDIEGVSYDAKSETALGGVYVSAIQNTVSHETVTNETTGEYNISKLSVDMEIQMNASKTNYTHNNFSFTPLKGGIYEINLFLLPDASHINVTAPAIVGLTQLYPFHQNVSYATVNIWNETWSASITTNSMGYFAFENLSPGTYYLNATHIKCKPSETYEVNLSSGEIEYVYILMHGLYNLTVKARDAGTHATIFNFKATLNDGEQTKETTSGWLNFTGVEYGIHKVEVGADGYYSAIEYVYVYGDVEKIVYLTPLETTAAEQGVGISYPPHQVEFACVDLFGNPLANVYVEATPISTTTGAWDWLLNLFGIRNESITYFINQTLNGTTDSRGAITFVMMENVEYEVRFVNESLGINKTIRIYPKADHYTVILTPITSSIVSSEDYITFNLSYEIIDEEEINLSLTYNDSLNQTQNLTFFVYNSTTLLYSQSFTNTSNISVSYTVPYKAGEEYMWGYSAFHSRFGEMGRSRILRIAWFLDLGISRAYCTWIAIAIILFLTAMFSFTTVKFGYVAIPMVSLIFAYIGWLPNISIIIIALCLGILAYMSKREKEVGV